MLPKVVFANDILKIRSSSEGASTRIVFELRQKPESTIFTLKNPDRLVMDIKAEGNNSIKKLIKNIKSSYIGNIRYAVKSASLIRIVLDSRTSIQNFKSFTLLQNKKHHHRLVIDVNFDNFNTTKNSTPSPKIKKTDSPILQKPIQDLPKDVPKLENDNKPKDVPKLENDNKPKDVPKLENDNKPKDVLNELDNRTKKELEEKIQNTSQEPLRTSTKKNKIETVEKILNFDETLIKRNPRHNNRFIVVIDPGHGGTDSGAIGKYYKTYEKNVTLAFSKNLQKILSSDQRFKVYLTRNDDRYLTLNARRNFARKLKADIFVSLHADSNPNPNTRGASVYTLSERAYDKESKRLSEQENQSDLLENFDLSKEKSDIANLLVDMVRRDAKNISSNFAMLSTQELGKEVKLLRGAHRFAGFKVLKGIDIPAILVELGYLSNKEEERSLNDSLYREKVTKALSRAIIKHFEKINKNKTGHFR